MGVDEARDDDVAGRVDDRAPSAGRSFGRRRRSCRPRSGRRRRPARRASGSWVRTMPPLMSIRSVIVVLLVLRSAVACARSTARPAPGPPHRPLGHRRPSLTQVRSRRRRIAFAADRPSAAASMTREVRAAPAASSAPDGLGQRRDEPQVLGGEVERERDRRRLRLQERGPLVADERRPGGAGGEDVVGERRGRCRPPRPGRAPRRRAWLSPKISGVDGQLHRRAAPERRRGGRRVRASASRTGRARSRSSAVAADHDRQLAGLGERDAARHRARRGCRRRRRGRPARCARIVSGGTVLMSMRRRSPDRAPASSPSGPP